MTTKIDIRTLLTDAFHREGIRYPEERLAAAEADCADLQRFLKRIREEAATIRAREL